MASFLSFIFYLFLSALIFIGLMIFILYRRVKNVTNMLISNASRTQQQERGRTYRADNGENYCRLFAIHKETGRKIFTKDEGEYVDYEEEK